MIKKKFLWILAAMLLIGTCSLQAQVVNNTTNKEAEYEEEELDDEEEE